MSQTEAAKVYRVGLTSVKRYLKLESQNATLAPKPCLGAKPKLGTEQYDKLRQQLSQNPDATLKQHAQLWYEQTQQRLSTATLCRTFARLGLTRKKRVLALVSVIKPKEKLSKPTKLNSISLN